MAEILTPGGGTESHDASARASGSSASGSTRRL